MKNLIPTCCAVILLSLMISTFTEGIRTACPQNEEWRECGPNCPPTCETLKDQVCCVVACAAGCFCKDGYMRLVESGKCVDVLSCPSAGVLKFEHSEDEVYESDKAFKVTVVRINGSHGRVAVHWRVVFDAGNSYAAYAGKSGTLIFEDGDTRQEIDIPLKDNSIYGPDIKFKVELYDASNKAEIALDQPYTYLTIKDDDMVPGYLDLEEISYNVGEADGKVEIFVVRKNGTDGKIKAQYTTSGNTAITGIDFENAFGEVIFEEGEKRKSIIINIKDDKIREDSKSFYFELFNQLPVQGTVNFRSLGRKLTATINIKDDDMEPGHFAVETTNYVVPESAGFIRIPIFREGGTDGEISLSYKTIISSATPSIDFIPIEGVLKFAEKESQRIIKIQILNDEVREPSESFDILLFNPTPGKGVINFQDKDFKKTIRITITDDDMKPGYLEIGQPSYSILEDNSALRIWIVRLGGTDGSLTVRVKTVAKTALASTDFIPIDTELTFAEGEDRKSIDIALLDDSIREPNETFEIELYNLVAGNGVINFRNRGKFLKSVVTIMDNDMKPGTIEIEDHYDVLENVGRVRVTVTRTGGSDGEIHVKYKTVQLTALEDVDFIPVSGELIFLENETKKFIEVVIKNDKLREATKVFHVQLYDSTAAPGVINFRAFTSEKISIITIKDDDMTPGYLVFEKPNYEVLENIGTLRIGVIRLDGTDGLLTVHYKTMSKSNRLIKGYNIDGVLEFKDGVGKQYIEIPIHNNDLRNDEIKFQVQIYDITPGEGVLNFRQRMDIISTLVTIKDDDMKPGFLELRYSNYTAKENVGSLMVCVLRKEGTDGTLRVKYRTISGTAVEGIDYEPMRGELTFREGGGDTMHLHIHIINNDIRNDDKIFYLEIYDPFSEYKSPISILGPIEKTAITISDDDRKPGKFELAQPSYTVFENDKVLKVGVIRLDGSDGMMRVKYKTTPQSALPSRDFFSSEGELTFQDKETVQYIEIKIIDNEVYEKSRTFEVQLIDLTDSSGLNFRGFGLRSSCVVTIKDDDMKPGYLEMQSGTLNVNEKVNFVNVVVVRRSGSDGEIRAKYKIIPITAKLNEDYELIPPVELIFREHETEKTIRIKIVNDIIREPTETFRIELYDQIIPPSYQLFNYRNRASILSTDINIIDDDMTPGHVEMLVHQLYVDENLRRIKIPVVRKGGADGHLKIKYRTIDGTAKESYDYEYEEGELEFEGGETELNITIDIIDDTIPENTEHFFVTLFDPVYELGDLSYRSSNVGFQNTSVFIIDNDSKQLLGFASMQQENITVNENGNIAIINVVRRGGVSGSLTVKYRTVDGTALKNADYISSSGLITFTSGVTRQTISIRIINDNLKESKETFKVELIDPRNELQPRNLGPLRTTTVIINDDDKSIGKFQFLKSKVTVQESGYQVTLVVRRFGGSDDAITLSWTSLDITAFSGKDYSPSQGLIPFAGGQMEQSITINIIDDDIKEDDEEFLVALHAPSNMDVLGPTTSVTVIIQDDDDDVQIYLDRPTYRIKRGDRSVKFHVFRRGGDLKPLTAFIQTRDGTAKGGVDYRRINGSIEFYDGEDVLTLEARAFFPRTGPNKEFYIELGPVSRGTVGVNKMATVTIENDGIPRLNGRTGSKVESSLTGSLQKVDGSVFPMPPIQPFKGSQVTSQLSQQLKTQSEAILLSFVNPTIRVKRSEGTVKLNIKRTGDFLKPLTLFFSTKDGTAKAGVDYRATRGDLTFLQNEVVLTTQVRLTDFIIEDKEDKTFFIEISLPSLGIIVPKLGLATVTIVNDIPEAGGKVPIGANAQSSGFSESLKFRGQGKSSVPDQTVEVPVVNHLSQQPLFIPPPPPQIDNQHQILACPVGMTFKSCAPACPKTCQTMDDPEPCQSKCVNACFCADGFVKESPESNKCILPEDCIGFRAKGLLKGKVALTAGIGAAVSGLLSGATG